MSGTAAALPKPLDAAQLNDAESLRADFPDLIIEIDYINPGWQFVARRFSNSPPALKVVATDFRRASGEFRLRCRLADQGDGTFHFAGEELG